MLRDIKYDERNDASVQLIMKSSETSFMNFRMFSVDSEKTLKVDVGRPRFKR